MKLKVINNPKAYLKFCTLQPSGKLIFPKNIYEKMGISKEKGIVISIDEEDPNSIYFQIQGKSELTVDFSVTGSSMYCNLRSILNQLRWNIREAYPVVLTPITHEENQYYKITKPIITNN